MRTATYLRLLATEQERSPCLVHQPHRADAHHGEAQHRRCLEAQPEGEPLLRTHICEEQHTRGRLRQLVFEEQEQEQIVERGYHRKDQRCARQ